MLSSWESWAVQLCPLWFISTRPVLASEDPGPRGGVGGGTTVGMNSVTQDHSVPPS